MEGSGDAKLVPPCTEAVARLLRCLNSERDVAVDVNYQINPDFDAAEAGIARNGKNR
jgi:hypothetical protein